MNQNRVEKLTILAFPIVLFIGIVLIPVVTDYNDHQLAEKAVGQTGRWFTGHLISAIAFSISTLSVNVIEKQLVRLSKSVPSLTRPLITIGAALYSAGLGADGIGPVAVQSAGHSPVIFFDGSGFWVTGIFVPGTIIFGAGLLTLTIGSIRLGVLTGWGRYISFISCLIFLAAPMILSGWALYGVAGAAFGIFVPFALAGDS
jgi:hypothetical protein